MEKSILVVTEGLGDHRFHGRVVLLVNEHTASAGEMVAAFAEENNLATIVGTKTPGRLLSGSAFKVGHGYILGLPVAGYLTWQGEDAGKQWHHSSLSGCPVTRRAAGRQGHTAGKSHRGGQGSIALAAGDAVRYKASPSSNL